MTYKSLLIHVTPGRDNSDLFSAGASLAKMLGASITGIAGAQLLPPFSEAPAADMMQFEREAAQEALQQAEAAFRAAFAKTGINLSWRQKCDYSAIGNFVAQEARAADLIVTSPDAENLLAQFEGMHVGPLVLQAGRPVLIVPKGQREVKIDKAVLAWKDTREARRAAADALPMLARAGAVSVVEVCAKEQVPAAQKRTADVVGWLAMHGIAARAAVEACEDRDLDGLCRFLKQEHCDLLVAGAYGHTRLREWMFGGITMDLLLPAQYSVLLSH